MPASISRPVGQTFVITPHPLDGSGNPVALSGHTVTHISSDETIAPVTADGIGTARAVGTATITTTVDGKSDTTTVTVTPVPTGTPTLAFTNTPPVLALAGLVSAWLTGTVAAVHKDGFGTPTGNAVTYASSNTAVATVNSSTGVVTPVAVGVAIITATSTGITATQVVTVLSNDGCVLIQRTGGDQVWSFLYDPQVNLSAPSNRLAALGDVRGENVAAALNGLGSPAPLITGTGANKIIQTDGTQNYCETGTSADGAFDVSRPCELVAGIESTLGGTSTRYPALVGDVASDYMAISGGSSIAVENKGLGRQIAGGEGATAGVPWTVGTRRLVIASRTGPTSNGASQGFPAQFASYCDVPPRLRSGGPTDPVAITPGAYNTSTSRVWVGATAAGPANLNPVNLSFLGLRVSPNPMTTAERAVLETYAAARNCTPDTSVTKSIIFMGDSIDVGTGTSVPLTTGWVPQMMTNGNWGGWDWVRQSANGRPLRTMLAMFPTRVFPSRHASRTRDWCFLFGGTNDLKLSPTPWAVIVGYTIESVQQLAAVGFRPIIATMLKRSNPTGGGTVQLDADTASYNTALRSIAADLLAQYGCVLVDWAADTRLDPDAHPENFNADGIHPNDTGAGIMASIADTALASYR